jgi:hypothetical protein
MLQLAVHEIEFVETILFGWVEGRFSRRQREDQPAMARIDADLNPRTSRKNARSASASLL